MIMETITTGKAPKTMLACGVCIMIATVYVTAAPAVQQQVVAMQNVAVVARPRDGFDSQTTQQREQQLPPPLLHQSHIGTGWNIYRETNRETRNNGSIDNYNRYVAIVMIHCRSTFVKFKLVTH